ncbi:MAG TPA: ABC transporter ATP-binding protein [Candidatus Binatia bacterium]|nr:ABC transporter ATP-binding protein [Candidatus Binatia bacterium]
MPAAVVTKELRRSYDGREAVRGVSVQIEEGEIFGLLGPNGAGKTTTLSMISTRIWPTSGDAWVFGKHVVKDVHAARRLLNVAPQEEALYPGLTGAENLEFWARLYGVPKSERPGRIEHALAAVELTARRDDRVDTYSGGMRRRLNLGCALVSNPRLVLLDEPTVGVDPQSRVHVFEAVRNLRAAGITILYTTHYLAEAEDLCDRIAIMDEGQIVALGTTAELLARSSASEVVELRLAAPSERMRMLQELPEVERVEQQGSIVRVYTRRAQPLLARLCATGFLDQPIVKIGVTPVSLETVFIELTGKELRD